MLKKLPQYNASAKKSAFNRPIDSFYNCILMTVNTSHCCKESLILVLCMLQKYCFDLDLCIYDCIPPVPFLKCPHLITQVSVLDHECLEFVKFTSLAIAAR